MQGAALEEGRTVYLRDGVTPTAPGPTYTKYEPDHAAKLLDDAEGKWEDAHLTRRPANRCQYLHDTIEQAFKALITADGRRIEDRHDLNNLWQQAQATGEHIGATRDLQQVEKLTKYAGDWRYDTPDDETNRLTGSRSPISQVPAEKPVLCGTAERLHQPRIHLQCARRARGGRHDVLKRWTITAIL